MGSTFADLAEHTGTLIALIGFLLAICGSLIGIIYKMMLSLKNDILKMVEKLDGKIGEVWAKIEIIENRQVSLRESLPKEYLRIEGPGFRALNEGVARIEKHLEEFIEDCRDGKCGASKIARSANVHR